MTYVVDFILMLFVVALVALFAWVLFDDSEVIRFVIWLKKKGQGFCKGGSDDNI